jgi:hypothetical protein
MLKVRSLVGFAAALVAMPLMGLPAWGAACSLIAQPSNGSNVGDYVSLGSTGCDVGPVTFYNITVSVVTGGDPQGTVTLGNFIPVTFAGPTGETEYGLALHYDASALPPSGTADVSWIYNVKAADGFALSDAFLSLAGNISNGGSITVSEILSNGITLSLDGAGIDFQTFLTPVGSLLAQKDQATHSNGGSATTSILTNAYSVVPGPIAGAGLPGLVAACGGLIGLARRRRRQTD